MCLRESPNLVHFKIWPSSSVRRFMHFDPHYGGWKPIGVEESLTIQKGQSTGLDLLYQGMQCATHLYARCRKYVVQHHARESNLWRAVREAPMRSDSYISVLDRSPDGVWATLHSRLTLWEATVGIGPQTLSHDRKMILSAEPPRLVCFVVWFGLGSQKATISIQPMGGGGKTNEVDIDIGITYHKTAEQIAIKNGVVSGCKYKDSNSMRPCFGDSCKDYEERPCYTLRDHFYLAGRKNNTADIQDEHDITETFSKLFNAGENGTARNTDKDLADQLEIYKRGDEYEELLNPADIITSKDSDNKELVQDFVQWVLSGDGQDVIANFHEEDGYCLYRGFPTEDGEDGEDVEASDCKWELS
ncbi:unnamed protein product [Aspergillus oryzae var. brunneus]|uniref:Unnamed protein product n=1 Tax=Aspergillus oryzae var. brunneus TaxID=332754 RepID=A0ABQ6KIK2_ASPOZ|nr:unnamed protein product [Aspergillus oryzae var. brunneus]